MVKDVRFERDVLNIPLSPNHYWKILSTKFGPMILPLKHLQIKVKRLNLLEKIS